MEETEETTLANTIQQINMNTDDPRQFSHQEVNHNNLIDNERKYDSEIQNEYLEKEERSESCNEPVSSEAGPSTGGITSNETQSMSYYFEEIKPKTVHIIDVEPEDSEESSGSSGSGTEDEADIETTLKRKWTLDSFEHCGELSFVWETAQRKQKRSRRDQNLGRKLRQTKVTDYFRQRKKRAGKRKNNAGRESASNIEVKLTVEENKGAVVVCTNPQVFVFENNNSFVRQIEGKRAKNAGRESTRNTEVKLTVEKNEGPLFVGTEPQIIVPPEWTLVPHNSHTERKLCMGIRYIAGRLYYFRDNGLWPGFYQENDYLLECVNSERFAAKDFEIFIIIERSIGRSYQRRYEEAKVLLAQAMRLLEAPGLTGLRMEKTLVAMAHVQKSALLRRDRDFLGAKEAVAVAVQNLPFISSPFAKALVYYELGNVMSVDDTKEAAKKYKRCVDMCVKIQTEFPDMYIKRGIYCFAKLGELSLGTHTDARKGSGHVIDTAEAHNWLQILENLSNEMPRSLQMLVLRLNGSFLLCMNDKQGAIKCTDEARQRAKDIGFGVQKDDLDERFREISLSEEDPGQDKS